MSSLGVSVVPFALNPNISLVCAPSCGHQHPCVYGIISVRSQLLAPGSTTTELIMAGPSLIQHGGVLDTAQVIVIVKNTIVTSAPLAFCSSLLVLPTRILSMRLGLFEGGQARQVQCKFVLLLSFWLLTLFHISSEGNPTGSICKSNVAGSRA